MLDRTVQDLLRVERRGLLNLARSLVRDEHAAEDVVQDAFVAALGRPLDVPGRVGGWLRGATRLLAANVRRSRRRRIDVEAAASRDELESEAVDPIAHEHMLRDVTDAVLALSEAQRAVVFLRFFEGLSLRDSAARLGVPTETVRTRQRRALAALRTKLDARYGGNRSAWCVLLGRVVGLDSPAIDTVSTSPTLGLLTKMVAMGSVVKCVMGVGLAVVIWFLVGLESPSATARREVVRADGVVGPLSNARPPTDTTAVQPELAAAVERVAVPVALDGQEKPSPEKALALTGFELTGSVVDTNGDPIAAARVRLGEHTGPSQTILADEEGEFALRSLELVAFVSARAPGFAPSGVQRIWSPRGEQASVRIVLPGAGTSCRFRVVGSRDQPVPDALVIVGSEVPISGVPLGNGALGMSPVPQRARTDLDGRVVFDGLAFGTLAVRVAPPVEFATWSGPVELPRPGASAGSGPERLVLIVLQDASTLRGTVTDLYGQPLADTSILPSGSQGAVRTAADGTYEIHGISPGQREVAARWHEAPRATEQLDFRPNEVTEWNPVIDTGLVMRGVVRDSAGVGLIAHVEVGTMSEPERIRWQADSDTAGRFEIEGLPTEALWIDSFQSYDAGTPVLHLRTRVEPVFAGRGDVTVELPAVGDFASYATWRVDDERATTTPGTTVRIRYVDAGGEVGASLRVEPQADGTYRVGPLHAGLYRVEVTGDFVSRQVTEPFEVAAKETVDIGVVSITEPGRVELLLADAARTGETCSLKLRRVDRNAHSASVRVVFGEPCLVRIPAGVWAIEGLPDRFLPDRMVVNAGQWQSVTARAW